jgi:hypothetical protein
VAAKIMTDETQDTGVFDKDTLSKMKGELFTLIRKYCHTTRIDNFRNKIFLHDSTPIEYTSVQILEVERFIGLVMKYWDYLGKLTLRLSYRSIPTAIELRNKISSRIDFYKTDYVQQQNDDSRNITVCIDEVKDVNIPENLLFGATILGLRSLSLRFLETEPEDGFEEFHKQNLLRIAAYADYLLKDRLLRRITRQYLENFHSIDQIIPSFTERLYQGKVGHQYRHLMTFLIEWKRFRYMMDKLNRPLREILSAYLDGLYQDKLYELWVLYQTLTIFEPIKQQKFHNNIFATHDHLITIEYQNTISLGWRRYRNNITSTEVNRRRDVVLRKHGKTLLVIDAKCMSLPQAEEEENPKSPATDTVNQIIMYLDYQDKCNKGLVLFADDTENTVHTSLRQGDEREIRFLPCYPFHQSHRVAFDYIKKIVISQD